MTDNTRTLGLILAEGMARRMGGATRRCCGSAAPTILERVLERLRPQSDAIILNANGDPARFAPFGLPIVPDDVPDFRRAARAGILAGLD